MYGVNNRVFIKRGNYYIEADPHYWDSWGQPIIEVEFSPTARYGPIGPHNLGSQFLFLYYKQLDGWNNSETLRHYELSQRLDSTLKRFCHLVDSAERDSEEYVRITGMAVPEIMKKFNFLYHVVTKGLGRVDQQSSYNKLVVEILDPYTLNFREKEELPLSQAVIQDLKRVQRHFGGIKFIRP